MVLQTHGFYCIPNSVAERNSVEACSLILAKPVLKDFLALIKRQLDAPHRDRERHRIALPGPPQLRHVGAARLGQDDGQVIGPPVQSLALLGQVRSLVVGASQMAWQVVQTSLDDMRLDAQLGHAGCCRPAQVMHAPGWDLDQSIQVTLRLAPATDAAVTRAKHELAVRAACEPGCREPRQTAG